MVNLAGLLGRMGARAAPSGEGLLARMAPLAIAGGGAAAIAGDAMAEEESGDPREARLSELQAESDLYRNAPNLGPDQIKIAQRKLNVEDDGVWEGITRRRADERQAEIKTEMETLRSDITRSQREATYEGNKPNPTMDALRFWGPIGAIGVGGLAAELLPWGMGRISAVRAARKLLEKRNLKANALLNAAPLMQPGRSAASKIAAGDEAIARAENVNEFFRFGGAGENVPFRMAKTPTEKGFTVNRDAADMSALYPLDNQPLFRGVDAYAGLGALEAAAFHDPVMKAERRRDELQAAFDKKQNPTDEDYAELERAKNEAAMLQAWQRLGIGYAGARAGILPFIHRYPNTSLKNIMQPNMNLAGAERGMLVRYLAGQTKRKGQRKR